MSKVLALNDKGQMTYCSAPPDMRGKGRCNHIAHQKDDETIEHFVDRINDLIYVEKEKLEPIKNNPSLFLAKKLWDQNIYIGMKMENRNMTFPQTKQIIDGVNDGSVILEDIQSVLDSRDAWREMFNTLYDENCLEYAAKLEGITAKHEALEPGVIRNGNVYISGVNYVPPIPDEKEIRNEYENILKNKDIEDRALELFCFISRKQVFWDGNKRTSLLIANKELVSHNCGTLCIDMNAIDEFNIILNDFYETGNKDKIKKFLRNQIKKI